MMSDIFVISQEAAKLLGVYEFLPASELFILGGKDLCRDKAVTQVLCENILFLIAGYQSDQLNHVSLDFVFKQCNIFVN